jgi:hypothetical protein
MKICVLGHFDLLLHLRAVLNPVLEVSADLSVSHVDEDVAIADEGGVDDEVGGGGDHALERVPAASGEPVNDTAVFHAEDRLVLGALNGAAVFGHAELAVSERHAEVRAHVLESVDRGLLTDTGDDNLLSAARGERSGYGDDTALATCEVRFPEDELPESRRHVLFLFGLSRNLSGGIFSDTKGGRAASSIPVAARGQHCRKHRPPGGHAAHTGHRAGSYTPGEISGGGRGEAEDAGGRCEGEER